MLLSGVGGFHDSSVYLDQHPERHRLALKSDAFPGAMAMEMPMDECGRDGKLGRW